MSDQVQPEQRNIERTDDPLEGLTLAEMTLVQQGLWAIGEAGSVDPQLVPDWRDLLRRFRPLVQARVAAITDSIP